MWRGWTVPGMGTVGKRLLNLSAAAALILGAASPALAIPTPGGPHLWLSTAGTYVNDNSDAWLTDSYVTGDNPFDLSIYNADSPHGQETAADATAVGLHLLVAVHEGESGIVTVNGVDYGSFLGTDLGTTGYGGGSHGVYQPPASHEGVFADIDLGANLDPLATLILGISYSGFSQVHFDAYSENGYYNPASHDVTGVPSEVPEPATLILMGSGLTGMALLRRRRGARKDGGA